MKRLRGEEFSSVRLKACYNNLMDNLEYLNHIAQSNRPVKARGAGASTSLIVKILLGGLVLFALILALGALMGKGSTKVGDLTKQVYVRTTNLDATITTYNKSLKSSQLRAIGISLSGTLANAAGQLSTYLSSKDSGKNALVPNEEITAAEAENSNTLNLALENAKLNGILDRTYATQMNLQVSLLMSLVVQLAARNQDQELAEILASYLNSLSTIEESLQNYSNPSD